MSLRLKAEAGDPRAQVVLAEILLIGRDVKPSAEEALHWLDAACARNHPDAFQFKAMLAAIGMGRPQSFDDAWAYLSHAAALGDARAKGQVAALSGADGFDLAPWRASPQATQVCGAPRVFTIKNFIPKSACDWIVAQSRGKTIGAAVWDTERGGLRMDAHRSNSLAPFGMLRPDLVFQLTHLRIAATTGMPIAHQEPTNVLCYDCGQEYKPHYDFLRVEESQAFADELQRIGQRIGTFLIYLNDDYEGGETEFPLLNWKFKGQTGDALMFWSASANGGFERGSLHAGLPVTKGRKWLLSKWLRAKPIPLAHYSKSYVAGP